MGRSRLFGKREMTDREQQAIEASAAAMYEAFAARLGKPNQNGEVPRKKLVIHFFAMPARRGAQGD